MTSTPYLPGSALDPDKQNQEVRTWVERTMRNRLTDAGAPSYDAEMVCSGIVIDFLTTGRREAAGMIRFLGGDQALDRIITIRDKVADA